MRMLAVAAVAVLALAACSGGSPVTSPAPPAAGRPLPTTPASVTQTLSETGTGTAQLAQVNFQPLPPSLVTLSQGQIAKIKG